MGDAQRILFVWPGAEFSVWDVGRGYRNALIAAGHAVRDYYLTRRMVYHGAAMEAGGVAPTKENVEHVAKQASETVVVEALYHRADLVVLCCGLNFHPIGLQLLKLTDFPIAIILTESPYEDVEQKEFCEAAPGAAVFTNDRRSARVHGWTYLASAYDPAIHKPVEPEEDKRCDVLFVGTGWAERQALLERVNWQGIGLRLYGAWPCMTAESPLQPFLTDVCIRNESLPAQYASARICLNLHRTHAYAESLNPRAYELAACGAFTISDERAEGRDLFRDAFVTFDGTPEGLEAQIRRFLRDEQDRKDYAIAQRLAVQGQTFEARAQTLVNVCAGALAL